MQFCRYITFTFICFFSSVTFAGNVDYAKPTTGDVSALIFSLKKDDIIKAVADGKVLYVGSSLKGHENMVIIEHVNSIRSVYFNNINVEVNEGDIIKKNQMIAKPEIKVPFDSTLHFQIRKNGEPINPITMINILEN